MTEPDAAPTATETPEPSVTELVCPNCARTWGTGAACQFCHQVEGLPMGIVLSSPLRRLGGYLLDGLFIVVTLFIGWLVWSLIVWDRGQTPGKQVLGMRCVKLGEAQKARWGTMFLREFVCKFLLFGVIIQTITFGLGFVLDFWLVWDSKNQELWDKMVGTVVVNDPEKALA